MPIPLVPPEDHDAVQYSHCQDSHTDNSSLPHHIQARPATASATTKCSECSCNHMQRTRAPAPVLDSSSATSSMVCASAAIPSLSTSLSCDAAPSTEQPSSRSASALSPIAHTVSSRIATSPPQVERPLFDLMAEVNRLVSCAPLTTRFINILNHPYILRAFIDFCALPSELALESLLFCMDVERFRHVQPNMARLLANYIYLTYLAPGAPLQVLSNFPRQTISWPFLPGWSHDPTTFDSALQKVAFTLKKHTMLRFERSPIGLKALMEYSRFNPHDYVAPLVFTPDFGPTAQIASLYEPEIDVIIWINDLEFDACGTRLFTNLSMLSNQFREQLLARIVAQFTSISHATKLSRDYFRLRTRLAPMQKQRKVRKTKKIHGFFGEKPHEEILQQQLMAVVPPSSQANAYRAAADLIERIYAEEKQPRDLPADAIEESGTLPTDPDRQSVSIVSPSLVASRHSSSSYNSLASPLSELALVSELSPSEDIRMMHAPCGIRWHNHIMDGLKTTDDIVLDDRRMSVSSIDSIFTCALSMIGASGRPLRKQVSNFVNSLYMLKEGDDDDDDDNVDDHYYSYYGPLREIDRVGGYMGTITDGRKEREYGTAQASEYSIVNPSTSNRTACNRELPLTATTAATPAAVGAAAGPLLHPLAQSPTSPSAVNPPDQPNPMRARSKSDASYYNVTHEIYLRKRRAEKLREFFGNPIPHPECLPLSDARQKSFTSIPNVGSSPNANTTAFASNRPKTAGDSRYNAKMLRKGDREFLANRLHLHYSKHSASMMSRSSGILMVPSRTLNNNMLLSLTPEDRQLLLTRRRKIKTMLGEPLDSEMMLKVTVPFQMRAHGSKVLDSNASYKSSNVPDASTECEDHFRAAHHRGSVLLDNVSACSDHDESAPSDLEEVHASGDSGSDAVGNIPGESSTCDVVRTATDDVQEKQQQQQQQQQPPQPGSSGSLCADHKLPQLRITTKDLDARLSQLSSICETGRLSIDELNAGNVSPFSDTSEITFEERERKLNKRRLIKIRDMLGPSIGPEHLRVSAHRRSRSSNTYSPAIRLDLCGEFKEAKRSTDTGTTSTTDSDRLYRSSRLISISTPREIATASPFLANITDRQRKMGQQRIAKLQHILGDLPPHFQAVYPDNLGSVSSPTSVNCDESVIHDSDSECTPDLLDGFKGDINMVHVSIPTVPATEIRASADLAAQSTTTPGGLHNASGDYSLDLALSRDSNRSSIMAEELMLANGGSTTDAPCPGGAISRVSSGKKLVISHIDIDAANRPQQQHKTECASYSAHDKSGGEQISDSRTVSIDDALSPLPEPKVLTQQRKIDKLSRFFGNPLDSSILATQCPDQASDCSMALPVNSSDAPGTYSTRIEKSTSNPGFGDRLSVPGKPSDHRSTTHFLRFQSISKGFRKSSKSFRLTLAPGLRGQKSQQRQQQVTAPSHAELRHTGTSPRWRLGMGNRMTRRAASPRVASDGSGKMGCYDTNWKDGCINNEKSAVRGTTRGNSGNWSCDNDMAATESMGMTPPSSSLSMSPGMRRTAPHTNKALPPLPNSAATTAHSTSTMNELPPITISKSSHIYTSCESEESVVVSSAKIVTAIPQLTTLSEANLFSEFTLLDEGSQPGTANTISASFAASLADFATRMPINVTDHASS